MLHSAINDAAFGPIMRAIDFVIVAVGFKLGFFSHNRFAARARLGPRVRPEIHVRSVCLKMRRMLYSQLMWWSEGCTQFYTKLICCTKFAATQLIC